MSTWIDRRLRGLALLAAGLVLLPAVSFAQQTTYTYQGTLLNQPTQDGATWISGQITLPAPLPANATNYVVTNAISWSFDGDLLLNSTLIPTLSLYPYGDVLSQTASFTFSTTNGVITAWTVNVSSFMATPHQSESLTLSMTGDSYSFLVLDGYCEFNNDCTPTISSNTHHGSWLNGFAQVAADQANYAKLLADYESMMEQRNTYLNDYNAATAEIAKLNTEIAKLNALIAQCRAHAGKC